MRLFLYTSHLQLIHPTNSSKATIQPLGLGALSHQQLCAKIKEFHIKSVNSTYQEVKRGQQNEIKKVIPLFYILTFHQVQWSHSNMITTTDINKEG